jgi:hypothetical protein
MPLSHTAECATVVRSEFILVGLNVAKVTFFDRWLSHSETQPGSRLPSGSSDSCIFESARQRRYECFPTLILLTLDIHADFLIDFFTT